MMSSSLLANSGKQLAYSLQVSSDEQNGDDSSGWYAVARPIKALWSFVMGRASIHQGDRMAAPNSKVPFSWQVIND